MGRDDGHNSFRFNTKIIRCFEMWLGAIAISCFLCCKLPITNSKFQKEIRHISRELTSSESKEKTSLTDSRRPVMYTFFENYNRNKDLANLLRAWETAWQDAGWSTKVLTTDNARNHPLFPLMTMILDETDLNTYEKLCFYRWVAMANAVPEEGGWMSDYDTFPLYIAPDEGIPYNGIFTVHEKHVPDLMSGSKSEWNRMTGLLMHTWKEHDGHLSDMYVLNTILKKYPIEAAKVIPFRAHARSGFLSIGILKVKCNQYHRNLKVIHFSHFSAKDALIFGWLEAQAKKKYGEDIEFTVFNRNYEMITKIDGMFNIFVEEPSVVNRYYVSINKHRLEVRELYQEFRGQLANAFIQAILEQCNQD